MIVFVKCPLGTCIDFYTTKFNTVFLLKIRHENNNIALASPNF